jgi:tagatose 1,6-diphosphate aldolase
LALSEAKQKRLQSLATQEGIIAALAMDQRKSLRQMIAGSAAVEPDEISDEQLMEFKAAVTHALTPHASAVLLDPEYGLAAASRRARRCGLLMTYEADGYENPRPHRMLGLMPQFSVRRLRELGADGIKILLSYTPFEDERANDEKRAAIERIGNECEALDMPFFLEPVGYDPTGGDVKGLEFAKTKPEIVIRSMEEFSRDVYKVDVLKVEFPVNAAFVKGSRVYCGRTAYSRNEALAYFREADRAGRRPYIYLSAGVSGSQFRESLSLAAEAGARYSGVLCGRATWQDGVPVYAHGGVAALEQWLASEGTANIATINECLRSATPWHRFE